MISIQSLKKLANHTLVVAVAVFTGWSCSTDVDLLAPYKSTPVIYGILEASADTQWVRINRTYLGEGNLNSYAQIKDSVEYDPSQIDARIHKINENFDTVATYTLDWMDLDMREEGAFYDEDIQMWYFTDELLFEEEDGSNFTFRLEVDIDGKRYASETSVIDLGIENIQAPLPTEQVSLSLGNYNTSDNSEIYDNTPMELLMQPPEIAEIGIFNYKLNFYFQYSNIEGEIDSTNYTIPIAEIDGRNVSGTQIRTEINSERFYDYIGSRLDTIPDLQSVRITDVRLQYTIANNDLGTYIAVNNPLFITFSQPPEYSNIEGALGIFGSRDNFFVSKNLSEGSIRLFNQGELTSSYCFCTAWQGLFICGSPSGC